MLHNVEAPLQQYRLSREKVKWIYSAITDKFSGSAVLSSRLLLLFHFFPLRSVLFYSYTRAATGKIAWKGHCPWSLCHESATLLYPTTFYWTRRYVVTEKPRRSIAWRLRPLARISRCGNCAEHTALFAYRITCSISRHLLSAISSWRAVHSARIDARECVPLVEGSVLSPSLSFHAHLAPYLFFIRIPCKRSAIRGIRFRNLKHRRSDNRLLIRDQLYARPTVRSGTIIPVKLEAINYCGTLRNITYVW